jgi:hypothetical protein
VTKTLAGAHFGHDVHTFKETGAHVGVSTVQGRGTSNRDVRLTHRCHTGSFISYHGFNPMRILVHGVTATTTDSTPFSKNILQSHFSTIICQCFSARLHLLQRACICATSFNVKSKLRAIGMEHTNTHVGTSHTHFCLSNELDLYFPHDISNEILPSYPLLSYIFSCPLSHIHYPLSHLPLSPIPYILVKAQNHCCVFRSDFGQRIPPQCKHSEGDGHRKPLTTGTSASTTPFFAFGF